MTSGQACVAATRMLVPQEQKDEALEACAPPTRHQGRTTERYRGNDGPADHGRPA